MVTSAEYGHMTVGRCITEADPRYLGCSNDVLPVLDGRCSGRRDCSFNIPDNEIESFSLDCPKFTMKYLNLEHMCIQGIHWHFTCE